MINFMSLCFFFLSLSSGVSWIMVTSVLSVVILLILMSSMKQILRFLLSLEVLMLMNLIPLIFSVSYNVSSFGFLFSFICLHVSIACVGIGIMVSLIRNNGSSDLPSL